MAQSEFERMVKQKQRKGYRSVPFDNASSGNIPSFQRTLTGSVKVGSGSGGGKITGPEVLKRLRNLARRIQAGFEPDTMLVEWGQLKAATGLVLEYAGREHGRKENQPACLSTPSPEAEVEMFDSGELEAALNEVSRYVRQALLA